MFFFPCGVREPPNLSDLEISEHTALEITNTCRTVIEEVLRWMFHVTVEGDWFVFARTVAGLFLLSYVGSFFDLLTFLYIGKIIKLLFLYLSLSNEILFFLF